MGQTMSDWGYHNGCITHNGVEWSRSVWEPYPFLGSSTCYVCTKIHAVTYLCIFSLPTYLPIYLSIYLSFYLSILSIYLVYLVYLVYLIYLIYLCYLFYLFTQFITNLIQSNLIHPFNLSNRKGIHRQTPGICPLLTYIQTASQPARQAGVQTDRHTDRQAGRHTNRETDRQAGRQTDIHTYIDT